VHTLRRIGTAEGARVHLVGEDSMQLARLPVTGRGRVRARVRITTLTLNLTLTR